MTGHRQALQVIFIHGPAASGKHTIGLQLSRLTGLPLFHNHLAVDAALSLFEFGTQGFKNVRSAVWRAAFQEAARSGRSFIFTFHPEASVEPVLVGELVESIESLGGNVVFVELLCAPDVVLGRLSNPSRANFRKMTDPDLYRTLEEQGAFSFPQLPTPLLRIDTSEFPPEVAASRIAQAIENRSPLTSLGNSVDTETALAEVERWAECPLPTIYRQLLPGLKGEILGEQVLLYPLDMVVERNETYQTKVYCPGHMTIGDDSGGRSAVISLTDPECQVFLVGHGSMDPDDFVPLNMTLRQWLDAECPVD